MWFLSFFVFFLNRPFLPFLTPCCPPAHNCWIETPNIWTSIVDSNNDIKKTASMYFSFSAYLIHFDHIYTNRVCDTIPLSHRMKQSVSRVIYTNKQLVNGWCVAWVFYHLMLTISRTNTDIIKRYNTVVTFHPFTIFF